MTVTTLLERCGGTRRTPSLPPPSTSSSAAAACIPAAGRDCLLTRLRAAPAHQSNGRGDLDGQEGAAACSDARHAAPPCHARSPAPAPPQGAAGGSGRFGTAGGEAGPLGTQPLPWVRELAASRLVSRRFHRLKCFGPIQEEAERQKLKTKLSRQMNINDLFDLE